jgi:dynein heavy chain
MEKMMNKMLNEINEEYYDSVRKAILDYVLKDDNEKLRIGIMTIFDPIKDYGENLFMGLEPDNEWRENVNIARDEISHNLVINSKATLKLMDLWKKYEKMHFLILPSKSNPTMTI